MIKSGLKSVGFLFLFMGLVYFLLLSKTGHLEQNQLKKRLELAKLEVERLQVENKNLLVKQTLLKNDESILAMEARKYYLLSENANILKFKEAGVSKKEKNVVSASSASFNIFQEKSKKDDFPLMMLYRFFYISVSLIAGIWVFFKLI